MPSSPTPTRTPTRRLVDRLLASPHYGERMALPWLDAARYADSNGFQQDGDTWQWIWRDWLVKALNDDMPFDQFTIRLLAGDLLPEATTEDRDRQRVQPQSPPERRRRRDRRGAAVREPVRPDRHHRHHLARPDDGVRPVPRPQIRSDHPEGLLQPARRLQPRPGERHAAVLLVADPRRGAVRRAPDRGEQGPDRRARSAAESRPRPRESSRPSRPSRAGGWGSSPTASPPTGRACRTRWPPSCASPRATATTTRRRSSTRDCASTSTTRSARRSPRGCPPCRSSTPSGNSSTIIAAINSRAS